MWNRGWIALGALLVALVFAGAPGAASASPIRSDAAARVSHDGARPAVRINAQSSWRVSTRGHRHRSPGRRRWAALHRAHLARRHRPEIARAPAATDRSQLAERGAAAVLDAASPIGRPAPPCGLQGLAACSSQIEAEHALILETRRAMALGVPAVALRVGFDDWRDFERRAEGWSRVATLDAYRIRTAFVEDAIARRDGLFRAASPLEAGVL